MISAPFLQSLSRKYIACARHRAELDSELIIMIDEEGNLGATYRIPYQQSISIVYHDILKDAQILANLEDVRSGIGVLIHVVA